MKIINLIVLLLVFQPFSHASLFKANSYQTSNISAKSIAVGDINNDGYNDVIMAFQHKGSIVAYLNDQQGGFKIQTLSIKRTVNQLELVDYNRDGNLDLVVLSTQGDVDNLVIGQQPNITSHLEVFINEGVNSYNMHTPFFGIVTNLGGQAFIAEDFNQDGNLDFIVTGIKYFSISTMRPKKTELYKGKNDFTFESQNIYFHIQKDSKVADFNSDGYLDIWNLSEDPKAYLFNSDYWFSDHDHQDINFESSEPLDSNAYYPDLNSLSGFLLEDLDGDGDVDIQASSRNGEFLRFFNTDNRFLYENSETELLKPFYQPNGYHYSQQYAGLLDLNNDGELDVLIGSNESERLFIVKGQGDETQVEVLSDMIENRFVSEMVTADFTADGFTDALTIGANGLTLWINNQQGNLSRKQVKDNRWSNFHLLSTGKMNQDAHVDMVLAGRTGISIKHGNGLGAFKKDQVITKQEVDQLITADLDVDGQDELIGVFNKKIFKWQLVSSADYIQTQIFDVGEHRINKLKVHDFDLDGDMDLSYLHEGNFFILQNTEQGFEQYQPFATDVVDYVWFNGDQSSELLISTNELSNQYDSAYLAMTYDPNTGFETQQVLNRFDLNFNGEMVSIDISNEYLYDGMMLADMDLDGSQDVVLPFTGEYENGLIWLNKSSDQWQAKSIENGQSDLLIFASEFADFNQDGYLDILGSITNINPSGGFTTKDYISMGSENGLLNKQEMALNVGTNNIETVDFDSDGDLDLIQMHTNLAVTQINTTNDKNFSGLWFNPDQSGHGLQLEQIDLNGSPAVNFSWFAFHNGKPFWLVGLAPLEGNSISIPVSFTSGGDFGQNFNPGSVVTQPWGQVDLILAGNDLSVSWQTTEPGFTDGNMSMQRLAITKATSPVMGVINSCHSGSWYNPAQSGHGFFINVIENQGEEQMTLAWYHYLAGEQQWLVAQGPVQGTLASMSAQSATGGQFPPTFVSSDVEYSEWGQITFILISDTEAKISWSGTTTDFPAGELLVEKLTQLDRYHCN